MTVGTGQAFVVSLPTEDHLFDSAVEVVAVLRKAGFETYVVGGAVRDLLRGQSPVEYDIATAATPDAVTALFRKTVQVGARFGVVRVWKHGHEFEVATFRTESGYSDGRRPDDVAFAGLHEDVSRRDFTINGMVMDPMTGEGLDLVGGVADLRDRLIRAIGEARERFAEDHLRMLRAVRFAAQTGFDIAPATSAAIREGAAGVVSVSRERVRDELEKILASPRPGHGLRLLALAGLLEHVIPEWHPGPSDVALAAQSLDQLVESTHAARWIGLLWDLGPDGADAAMVHLRHSNPVRDTVVAALRAMPRLQELPFDDLAQEKRLLRQPFVPAALDAMAARLAVTNAPATPLNHARARLAGWGPGDLHPERLVDGHDAQAAGLKGASIAMALERVEDGQLRGDITTREQALTCLRTEG